MGSSFQCYYFGLWCCGRTQNWRVVWTLVALRSGRQREVKFWMKHRMHDVCDICKWSVTLAKATNVINTTGTVDVTDVTNATYATNEHLIACNERIPSPSTCWWKNISFSTWISVREWWLLKRKKYHYELVAATTSPSFSIKHGKSERD